MGKGIKIIIIISTDKVEIELIIVVIPIRGNTRTTHKEGGDQGKRWKKDRRHKEKRMVLHSVDCLYVI
jgi:hypothetical protein